MYIVKGRVENGWSYATGNSGWSPHRADAKAFPKDVAEAYRDDLQKRAVFDYGVLVEEAEA